MYDGYLSILESFVSLRNDYISLKYVKYLFDFKNELSKAQ